MRTILSVWNNHQTGAPSVYRIKASIVVVFSFGVAVLLATDSLAYPPFLRAAKKFGAKDCTFCHVNEEGGEPFSERGKWLVTEKERRKAEVVDPEWLAAYKPGRQATSDPPKPGVPAIVKELTDLLTEWVEAVKKHDHTKLNQILADNFKATDEEGRVLDKSEYMAADEQLKLESYSFRSIETRDYGNTALLLVRWNVNASYEGKDISGEYQETQVWVKTGGRWQAAALHVSRAPAAAK
jgi:ketosteroid isomerase-like protein